MSHSFTEYCFMVKKKRLQLVDKYKMLQCVTIWNQPAGNLEFAEKIKQKAIIFRSLESLIK